MRHFNHGRFCQQVRFLQQQFLQDGNLPFSNILSTGLIEQALTALQVGLVNCVYTPLVTLRVFLGQGLAPSLTVAVTVCPTVIVPNVNVTRVWDRSEDDCHGMTAKLSEICDT